jgi:ABC-type histidine transport system ATPase subunit
MRAEDLVACDQALFMSYVRTGDAAAARALAEEGRTMLLVTHEMGFAREVANRVIFLHQGVVEEDGSPAAVFGQPKSERCRQFLASQLR